MKRKVKCEKGITLMELIITVIVLLILASVAISSITNDGILSYTENAIKEYNQALKNEENRLKENEDYLNENPGEDETEEGITKDESFIGCYADIDNDGDIDGVIFADLAIGMEGKWFDEDGVYSYEQKSTLNNYTIRDAIEVEKGLFKGATNKVIAPINTVEENDRFYLMALENFTTAEYTDFYWYYNAYGIKDCSDTEVGFGTGRENTKKMIEIWNKNGTSGVYEGVTQDNKDIWKHIQGEVANGWFIPSRAEWSAFADAFKINSENYMDYGLNYYYWSSSWGNNNGYPWYATLRNGYMNDIYVDGYNYVRLCTTF